MIHIAEFAEIGEKNLRNFTILGKNTSSVAKCANIAEFANYAEFANIAEFSWNLYLQLLCEGHFQSWLSQI